MFQAVDELLNNHAMTCAWVVVVVLHCALWSHQRSNLEVDVLCRLHVSVCIGVIS